MFSTSFISISHRTSTVSSLFLIFIGAMTQTIHARFPPSNNRNLCHSPVDFKVCRTCADGFDEFNTEDCCGDVILNSLCQSFVENADSSLVERTIFRNSRKRSAAVPRPRFMLGKKNRNTFLGKRGMRSDEFHDDDEYENINDQRDALDDADIAATLALRKRTRNKFLGKRFVIFDDNVHHRFARSADNNRVARSIDNVVQNQIASSADNAIHRRVARSADNVVHRRVTRSADSVESATNGDDSIPEGVDQVAQQVACELYQLLSNKTDGELCLPGYSIKNSITRDVEHVASEKEGSEIQTSKNVEFEKPESFIDARTPRAKNTFLGKRSPLDPLSLQREPRAKNTFLGKRFSVGDDSEERNTRAKNTFLGKRDTSAGLRQPRAKNTFLGKRDSTELFFEKPESRAKNNFLGKRDAPEILLHRPEVRAKNNFLGKRETSEMFLDMPDLRAKNNFLGKRNDLEFILDRPEQRARNNFLGKRSPTELLLGMPELRAKNNFLGKRDDRESVLDKPEPRARNNFLGKRDRSPELFLDMPELRAKNNFLGKRNDQEIEQGSRELRAKNNFLGKRGSADLNTEES